jgi:Right handed beta helix region
MAIYAPRKVAFRHLRRWAGAIAVVAALLCLYRPVGARTLEVGPDQPLKTPSAAAAIAMPGDTVDIAPGEYFDCALWTADHLTIKGKGDGAVITDKTCQGKGLFITKGNDITIRNLTFARARVPDHNGAGIRAEGKNLTIEHSRFVDNEEGILAGDSPQSRITIANSAFIRNGRCEGGCAHGIYVGHIALLRIVNSKFFETHDGHHIKSRALRTELIGNEIMDGPKGTASYEVELPNGGSLIMKNNVLEKGPNNGNHTAAVSIGAEGVTQHTGELIFEGNKFTNDDPHKTFFVKNLTATEAILTGNSFKGNIEPLSGDGSVH